MPCPLTEADWEEPCLPLTQEALLRSLAPHAAWYKRPPDAKRDAPVLDDFSQWVHGHVVSVLKARDAHELRGQDLSPSRRALRHVCYKILCRCVQVLTHDEGSDQLVPALREDLTSVTKGAVMPVRHWLHPSAGESHRLRNTPHGPVLPATTADVKLVAWLKGSMMDEIADRMPGLTRLSPEARVTVYATRMRRRLRSALDSAMPDAAIRRSGADILVEEWEVMTPIDLMKRALAVAGELGIDRVLDAPGDEAVALLDLERRPVPADLERRLDPLIQQLAARLAMERSPANAVLAEQWGKLLERHKIAPCDRPSMSVAMLAAYLHDPRIDLKRIRELVGTGS
jgi:hypothetical protein